MDEVKEIRVGIADLNLAYPPDRIITVGLGSCVGIALYDQYKKIGGLAHIMLPDSRQFNNITNEKKFADLAIPILIEKMVKQGSSVRNIKAKIAGGASMFNFTDKRMNMDIGKRNSMAVKNMLREFNIPILSEDVGGNKGRTMILRTSDFIVQIRTVGLGIKEI
ncbi:chemotaxis protein [Clostridium pasteurianum]|uniref:Probable chemoreceptor glutamine deamidase CheD n=1 Tax=Clostridium pasteurianum BC1 TaxID=86416 RepID=R4K5G1_CLOPA|nr:chemotaxis protein [Clostridium pasteurianum]AGK97808.1 chemotaxis protein [Clostridium pasteurianum BC1]